MNKSEIILVTGATGRLGVALSSHLEARGHRVIRQSVQSASDLKADLSLPESYGAFRKIKPTLVIHCAALTDVDACEKNPQLAEAINVRAVDLLNRWAMENTKAHFVFISTDLLYDGEGPHKEAQIAPKNKYALTKAEAEKLLNPERSTVLRTNFFGPASSKPSLSDWIIQSIQEKKSISLWEDVYFSPLSLFSLSQAIEKVVEKKIPGIFNLGSRDGLSKWSFGAAIAKELNLSMETVEKRKFPQDRFPAFRPLDIRMDVSSFEKTFDIKLNTLEEEIRSLAR